MKELPKRKWINHITPDWIRESEHIFFLTLCCKKRGVNQLAKSITANILFEAVESRMNKGLWFPFLVLLMPDHLHGLFSFPNERRSMQDVVTDYKRWISSKTDVDWQRGFFDHRLRSNESASQKFDYILMNPVRAGLCLQPEEWPYVYRSEVGTAR
jgi:putative transposase